MAQAASNFIPTDYTTEQQSIDRQRRYADLLREQSMQPDNVNQMAGGWVLPYSPFAGAAKALNSYAARYKETKADERQKSLADAIRSDRETTLTQAQQLADGTPGHAAIPMPADELGGGPGAPAQAPQAGNYAAALRALAGSRDPSLQAAGTQGMIGEMLTRGKQGEAQAEMARIMGGGAPTGAPQAQPMPVPQAQPGQPTAAPSGPPQGMQPVPQMPSQGPQPVPQGSPPPGAQPVGQPGAPNADQIRQMLLSPNPQVQAMGKQLMATMKPEGGIHYDAQGNGYTLNQLGQPIPISGAKEHVSPDKKAELDQAERHYNGLSAYQKQQLNNEAQRLGISRQELLLNRIKTDPFNMFNTDGIGGGGGRGGGPGIPVPAGAQPVPGTQNPNAGLTGEDFLKTLAPGVASQVKLMAEGKLPITGMSARNPQMMQLLTLASQYEPGFDATVWKRRNETATAFSKGKQGDSVRAVNQALNHADLLDKKIEALDNYGGVATPLNYIANPVSQALGDPRQGAFQQTAQALGSELRKVFAGSGGGGLTELKQWEGSLPVNASKAQQKAYLQNGMELLHGAIGALDDQYQRGMGPNKSVMDIISPKAKAVLQRLESGGATPAASNDDPLGLRR